MGYQLEMFKNLEMDCGKIMIHFKIYVFREDIWKYSTTPKEIGGLLDVKQQNKKAIFLPITSRNSNPSRLNRKSIPSCYKNNTFGFIDSSSLKFVSRENNIFTYNFVLLIYEKQYK